VPVNSPQGQIVQCSKKLQKTQELHLRLYRLHDKFMTVQLEKDLSMACLEGLPGESFFSIKENVAARLMFAKLHLNKPQDFWNKVLWTD